jgi:hypothetical protein
MTEITTDPLHAARERGAAAARALLSESELWTEQQVATALEISRPEVRLRRFTGRLLAAPTDHGIVYPAWQFSAGGTLAGLEEVLAKLVDHDPWMQLRFFVSPSCRCGNRSPLDLLRAGDLGGVLSAARAYGLHGAD